MKFLNKLITLLFLGLYIYYSKNMGYKVLAILILIFLILWWLPDKKIIQDRRISKKLRYEVLKRDEFKCVKCGRGKYDVKLNVDHIKPFSKGGRTEIDNLQTLCWDCNIGKGNRED